MVSNINLHPLHSGERNKKQKVGTLVQVEKVFTEFFHRTLMKFCALVRAPRAAEEAAAAPAACHQERLKRDDELNGTLLAPHGMMPARASARQARCEKDCVKTRDRKLSSG